MARFEGIGLAWLCVAADEADVFGTHLDLSGSALKRMTEDRRAAAGVMDI